MPALNLKVTDRCEAKEARAGAQLLSHSGGAASLHQAARKRPKCGAAKQVGVSA